MNHQRHSAAATEPFLFRLQSRTVSVYLFCHGAGAGAAGVPVVAGASSGVQVIALRSYLNPFAAFSASFVEFMTRYHLLLFLLVTWTASNGTATSFSPIPRKPPAPTISAVILPSRSTSTSMISPILLSPGS